ncbi:hypothetical protein BC629DRAFT_789331 [Irpex lacteus]|nr:hypothetical protein BC629DRAFT_789331 [Irpex lacteus]
MLFRDGTIYFIILLLFNVLQIVDDNIPVLFALGVIQPFFEILQPTIVCHFILNLRRQIGPAQSPCVSSDQLHSLRFRVLGNIGHSLQISGEDEDDQEDKDLSETETHVARRPDRHVPPGTATTAAEEADYGHADVDQAAIHIDV